MKRLGIATLITLGLISLATSQVITMPPPAGVVINGCVYETTPTTLNNTQLGYIQCDNQGRVISSPASSSSPSAVKVTDGTNGVVAVKPASTPAVATDPSMVTQLNPLSPGIIALGANTKANSIPTSFATDQYIDPCMSPLVLKSSVIINTSSAATTQLIAVSGSTSIYVCGFSLTVNNVVTTASTFQFEYGTSTNCTGTHALTGLFNTGSVLAGTPTVVTYGNGAATIFSTPASQGLCIVTAGSGLDDGVLTYVQQ